MRSSPTDPQGLRLGDYCSKIGSGATPRGGKDAYLDKGPYSLIRSQNILNESFSFTGLAYISQGQADKLSNVEVMENDVLLNITGDSVARACQVALEALPARVNQHVAIIRPRPDVIDPRFLRYFLVSPEMQAHMLSLAASGATRNALTKGMIENFKVPNIPIHEQRSIANLLGTLDDKIDLNRRMNETLEAMARALFKDWFVNFGPTKAKMDGRPRYLSPEIWNLFPDRLDDDGKPEGWKYGTLSDLAETNSKSWTANKHPEFVDYVDLSNTKWGTIESVSRLAWANAPSRARRIAKVGDTILGTTRPGNGSFAYISQNGLTISTGFAVLSPKNPLYRDFVYVAVSDPSNIKRLANLADGHGGAYPAVKPSAVAETEIVIASKPVFAKYAEIASEMRNKIETAKLESRTLAQTRDFLLPKLMSGEIRVVDAEKQIGTSV